MPEEVFSMPTLRPKPSNVDRSHSAEFQPFETSLPGEKLFNLPTVGLTVNKTLPGEKLFTLPTKKEKSKKTFGFRNVLKKEEKRQSR